MTEVKLIVKCCSKKKTRKKPESAMATFLAIEEEIIPIMVFFSKCSPQKYASIKGLPKKRKHLFLKSNSHKKATCLHKWLIHNNVIQWLLSNHKLLYFKRCFSRFSTYRNIYHIFPFWQVINPVVCLSCFHTCFLQFLSSFG